MEFRRELARHSPILRADGSLSVAKLALVLLAGMAAGVASALAVVNSGVVAHPLSTGIGRGLTVVLLVWVGCYVWARRPGLRVAPLIVIIGFLFAAATMVASGDPRVFAGGRLVAALMWVALLYLFLSFPTGRIEGREARWAMIAMVAMTVLLWVPVVLLSHRLPLGGAFFDCRGPCPPNGLRVSAAAHGVGDAVHRATDVWDALILAVAAILVGRRFRAGSRLVRRALAPPLLVMCAIAGVNAVLLVLTGLGVGVGLQRAAGWAGRAAIVALPFSFLAGLVMGRVLAAEASRQLLGGLADRGARVASVARLLTQALDDPSLSLAVWIPDARHYVDAAGVPVDLPERGSGRSVWRVDDGDHPLALIVHDAALDHQTELASAAVAACRLSLEYDRLEADAWRSLRELRESKRRVLSAADAERRRIERDLHDSVQQRLLALQLKLAALFERSTPSRDDLRGLEAEAETAVDELRALIRGIFPPVLHDRGLLDALRAMAMTAPVRTRIDAQELGRLSPDLESTVYFCCAEALQNAAKHAGAYATVMIRLRHRDGELAFEVHDDGVGFDPLARPSGRGLANIRDRVDAVGGQLEVHSGFGHGTTIIVSIPITPDTDEQPR